MRLLRTFEDEKMGHRFYIFLLQKKIESQYEKNADGTFDIWIIKEDQIESAKKHFKEFMEDPGAQAYDLEEPQPETAPPKRMPKMPCDKDAQQSKLIALNFMAPLTRLFVIVCAILYLMSSYQVGTNLGKETPFFPQVSRLQADLLYDYPSSVKLGEQLNEEYQVTKVEDLTALPPEGQKMLDEMKDNPTWPGFYTVLLNWKDRDQLSNVSLFGSIRDGQIWRLVTPIFLHAGILHILFNMLWLWMLGKMVELNMGSAKLLLFVIITAAFTNTLQYLMTGPFFMGFSGVVAAMAGYVWVRKKDAPWEIYLIDRSTLIFLWVFIFGLLALQIIAFFLQIFHIITMQLHIANTAHVSGVLFGMILAKLKFFQRKA